MDRPIDFVAIARALVYERMNLEGRVLDHRTEQLAIDVALDGLSRGIDLGRHRPSMLALDHPPT